MKSHSRGGITKVGEKHNNQSTFSNICGRLITALRFGHFPVFSLCATVVVSHEKTNVFII